MSAKIISVTNQKGGSGKTTVTMNLAAGLEKKGRVLVIDADPQGSASQWSQSATEENPFPVSVISVGGDLAQEVKRFARDYDFIIIDCPPTLESDHTQKAMKIANYVLIPVLPSPLDLWASVKLVDMVEQARMFNRDLKTNIVINQLEPKSAISRAMKDALAEFPITALDAAMRRRAIYRNAAIEGGSVFSLGKQAAAARTEFEQIIEEFLV